MTTSNGLAFSPDGRTLYFSDTPRFVIYRYDYDSGLRLRRRRIRIAVYSPNFEANGYGSWPSRWRCV